MTTVKIINHSCLIHREIPSPGGSFAKFCHSIGLWKKPYVEICHFINLSNGSVVSTKVKVMRVLSPEECESYKAQVKAVAESLVEKLVLNSDVSSTNK